MFNVNEAINDIIDDINEDYYESCYDAIYEELCDRVNYGELTLEEAEMINVAAAEKYITEFNSDIKRHYDYRLAKEKKTHNHDKFFRDGSTLCYVSPNKDLKKSEDRFEREGYDHGPHTYSSAFSNFLDDNANKMKLKHYKGGEKDARYTNADVRIEVSGDQKMNRFKKNVYKEKLKNRKVK